MSKANPRKQRQAVDPEIAYARSCFRDLDTVFDRAAVDIIGTYGIFSQKAQEVIEEFIQELGAGESSRKIDEWRTKYYPDIEKPIVGDAEVALHEREDLHTDELTQVTETAFRLGMAVGRRLGGHVPLSRGDRRPA